MQRHSFQLCCSNCQTLVHVKCLPFVTKNDSIYVERDSNIWFCSKCCIDIFPFNSLEDEEYSDAILDLHDSESAVPFHLLFDTETAFSPFEFNDDGNSPLSDIDPDIQYFATHCNQLLSSSNYFLEDSFNKKLKDLNIPSNCLSLFHSNIRSASKNLNKLLPNYQYEIFKGIQTMNWVSHDENAFFAGLTFTQLQNDFTMHSLHSKLFDKPVYPITF